jgi:hypothetical protein
MTKSSNRIFNFLGQKNGTKKEESDSSEFDFDSEELKSQRHFEKWTKRI